MLLELVLLTALARKPVVTFDPASISSITCPERNRDYFGSYTICSKAILAFGGIVIDKPLPDTIRLDYRDGSIIRYSPKKCKSKDNKRGEYVCPDVMWGPKPI